MKRGGEGLELTHIADNLLQRAVLADDLIAHGVHGDAADDGQGEQQHVDRHRFEAGHRRTFCI